MPELWRKSSYSGAQNCVEVATLPGEALVRDSKAGETGPVLKFPPGAWAAFLDGIRAGEFPVNQAPAD